MYNEHTLTLSCNDQPGLVAGIAGLLFRCGGNISEVQQYCDPESNQLFMRVGFQLSDEASLEAEFPALAQRYGMRWRLRRPGEVTKVLMLVSKFTHCLGDLLYRKRIGELEMDVVGIVSNHPRDALDINNIGDIPFHYLPVSKETKAEQEAQIKTVFEESGADLVILARYMQILSDDLSAYLSGRCINIHHSFLPGFKGAKPYHQAHARGVKMIGATAHYVTEDLDEGPIIEQDVQPVTHSDTADTLVRKGRDVERRVLAQAVRLHLHDRIFINGTKTVIFKE